MIWLVQTNLGAYQDYVIGIKEGCEQRGDRFIGHRAVPFSEEVPKFDGQRLVVAYGSVDIVHQIHNSGQYTPGVFFNDNFTYRQSVEHLGEKMLNYSHVRTSLMDVKENIVSYAKDFAEDGHLFIRPNKDLKEFNGEIIKVDDLLNFIDKIDRKRTLFSPDVEVIVSRPYNLNKEWRVFIVDNQIVSACRYKKNAKLSQSASDIPHQMLEFIYDTIIKWTPHPVCVMDVCETGGNYYVVEFNCFNSSGFYKNNIPLIVRKISEWVEKQEW